MNIRVSDRQHWLAVLAKASVDDLERCWRNLAIAPEFRHLRTPETGLVMLRGRMSGAGAPFNVGEMTVTRCSVVLSDGTVGHGYVGGSDARHAEIAALCDALLQTETQRSQVAKRVIAPLAAAYEANRQRTAARTAATRVEFFTLARESGS
ncbi:MAG TPA: phosphonate C-P lyase system protein PhnG [Stellaceae bacterium]|nr:phosphonate C-P lyase system protein PhnG [Stellaceae bacterium]